jgi:hypothetical protein
MDSAVLVNLVIAVVVALVMSKALKVVTRDGDIWTLLARIALCYAGAVCGGQMLGLGLVPVMGVNVLSSLLGSAGLYLIVTEILRSIKGDS